MDQRERLNDVQTALIAALDGRQSEIWTALPGIIKSYDAAKLTVTVQPTVQGLVRDAEGVETWVSLPLLLDVPVVFPSGNGFLITWPLADGTECLVVFACRCIDAWWQSGGVQVQAELRMHDLSDGFCLPGPRSQVKLPASAVDTSNLQIRSEDGDTVIELTPSGVVNIKAPSGLNITGDVNITGSVVATGEGTFNGSHTVSQHRHGGVQTGAGQTGTPTG